MSSVVDRTEKVLRDMHVLFAKAEPFENSKRRVVIDKMRMMNLLKDLSDCIFDMYNEYEMTMDSRRRAQLVLKHENDELINQAKKNAEDIYAASLMYSDRSLMEIADIIKDADARVRSVQDEMHNKIKKELATIKSNQFELKGQLQDLVDTEKYLKLIEDENKRIKKAKENGEEFEEEPSPTTDIQVDIKVNEDYFREQGYEDLLETEEKAEDEIKVEPEINVNLDAEYFAWKEDQAKGEKNIKSTDDADKPTNKEKKGGLFGFTKKNS